MKIIILIITVFSSLFSACIFADDLEYNLTDAINRGDFDYAENLIKQGADVNKTVEPFKQSPIIISPLRGIEFVELLIDNGADVNAKDQDNTTALINACLYGNAEVARYLLANGADIHLKNNDDMDALEAAEISENRRLIKLIKSKLKIKK
jgi:uncharacterized protein